MHAFAEQLVQTFFIRKLVWLIPVLATVSTLSGLVLVPDPPTEVLSAPYGAAG